MSNAYEDELNPTSTGSLSEGVWLRGAVAIILAILLFNTGTVLYAQSNTHRALAQGEANLESPDVQKALAQGQMIDQKLSDLVHAVVALAATDAEAQKIMNEMHISVGGAPVPAPSSTGK